jgi:hypothetical protein
MSCSEKLVASARSPNTSGRKCFPLELFPIASTDGAIAKETPSGGYLSLICYICVKTSMKDNLRIGGL